MCSSYRMSCLGFVKELTCFLAKRKHWLLISATYYSSAKIRLKQNHSANNHRIMAKMMVPDTQGRTRLMGHESSWIRLFTQMSSV